MATKRIKTAHHRIHQDFRKFIAYVEVDETYVGGKAKNKHKGPGGCGDMGERRTHGKAIVADAIKRKGDVICRVIERADVATLNHFIENTVSTKVSLLATDDSNAYWNVPKNYRHGVVNHGRNEYVHGLIHTQTIDSFWSMIKRGIMGTFHKVSKKYLQLYVNEFGFRHNNRENNNIFQAAIRSC